jgi:hypothetical protein
MAWTVAGIAGIWLAVLLISIFSPDLITDQQEQVPVAAFGAWFWGVVATGLFLWAMGRLRGSGSRQPEGRCRVVVGRSAAWGRPALPGCSTKLVSSATTILTGCPPWCVGARSRQCSKGIQRGRWRARRLQELTAGDPDVEMGGPGRRGRQ